MDFVDHLKFHFSPSTVQHKINLLKNHFFPHRLYDGRVLCELMNEIEEGAIPQEVSQIHVKPGQERKKNALLQILLLLGLCR
jgi:hypothetical protein